MPARQRAIGTLLRSQPASNGDVGWGAAGDVSVPYTKLLGYASPPAQLSYALHHEFGEGGKTGAKKKRALED